MFANKTHLSAHLASSAHRCLTVICPWCKGRNKTFTRIADLEIHYNSVHTEVHVPKKVFSRQNGFYLAKYPKDYARVEGKVTPYGSDEAYQARKAVRSWAEGFDDKKERTEVWNTGWKEGAELARSERSVSSDRRVIRSNDSKTATKGKEDKAVEREGSCSTRRKSQDGKEKDKEVGKKHKTRVVERSCDRGNQESDREETVDDEEESYDKRHGHSIGKAEENNLITSGKRKRQRCLERDSKQSKTDEADEDEFESYQDDIDLGEDAVTEGNLDDEKQVDDDKVIRKVNETEKVVEEKEKVVDEKRDSDVNSDAGTSSSSESSISIFCGLGSGIKERAYVILRKVVCPYVHLRRETRVWFRNLKFNVV